MEKSNERDIEFHLKFKAKKVEVHQLETNLEVSSNFKVNKTVTLEKENWPQPIEKGQYEEVFVNKTTTIRIDPEND